MNMLELFQRILLIGCAATLGLIVTALPSWRGQYAVHLLTLWLSPALSVGYLVSAGLIGKPLHFVLAGVWAVLFAFRVMLTSLLKQRRAERPYR